MSDHFLNIQSFDHGDAIRQIVYREALRLVAWQERELRRLLSQWVSGCDPVMIFKQNATTLMYEFVGLGVEDDPTGMIVLHADPQPQIKITLDAPAS